MGVVEYEKKNHLSIITLNRPDRLNTFTEDMFTALGECWTRYHHDDDAWIAILTARGKAFSAGDTARYAKGFRDALLGGLGILEVPARSTSRRRSSNKMRSK